VNQLSKLITIKDLTIKYGDYTALENISFSIKENKFITIIGPNGGGKTTLIKAILGFIEPYKGQIIKSPNLKIGYVPQKNSFEQEFPISVSQVILSGDLDSRIKLLHRFKSKSWNRLKDTLEQLDIMDLKDKQINELSGGQLQKVLLGRAIISNPNLLILDEPTNHLDLDATIWLTNYLKTYSKTFICVSHDNYFIDKICTTIIHIDRKKLNYYHGNIFHY
jgi:zinc transport system ATP-binding protein